MSEGRPPDLIVHRLALRPGMIVELALPADFHADDAMRLSQYLATLALPLPALPPPPPTDEPIIPQANDVERLLRLLCEGIVEPPQTGRGQRRHPLPLLLCLGVMQVYDGQSARRAAAARDRAENAPHYNSVLRCLENPAVTRLLQALIEDSAAPLAALETTFTADRATFETATYRRDKGASGRDRVEIRAHATFGVLTQVITTMAAMEASGGADPPAAPAAGGGVVYVPFRSSGSEGAAEWRRMAEMLASQREAFRANRTAPAESALVAVKRVFGSAVGARIAVAQVNEVLCKALCHNLACLVRFLVEREHPLPPPGPPPPPPPPTSSRTAARRLSLEQLDVLRQQVIELARAGRTAPQIAQEILVAEDRVRIWCRRAGVDLAKGHPGRPQTKPLAHLKGRERYQAARALSLCATCEQPALPGHSRCARHLADVRLRMRARALQRIEAGACGQCGKPLQREGAWRCPDCRARRDGGRPRQAVPREPMIREWGTFLNEDLAQERILAELEGRTFDKCDFFKKYAPRQELAILDRPMSDGGDTLHEVTSAGDFWMAPRAQGGALNPAEERMVRRLDREPSIDELRADPLPWQSYVHAVSLENAEDAVVAWLAFIARMTPDEYAETNIKAQIEAILPGLTLGEVLRSIRECLGWSERGLEQRATLLPGVVRRLERGEISYRACDLQALAAALGAVAELEPGRLRAHLSAVWGRPPDGQEQRRTIVQAERDLIKKRQAPLTQNLGEAIRRGFKERADPHEHEEDRAPLLTTVRSANGQ